MHLGGIASAEDRIDRNPRVGAGFRGIDVFERERILRQVRRVRITPDAVVIIRIVGRREQVARVRARREIPVDVVARLREQAQRVEIRPALAHAARLQRADARAAADEPVAQPVRVFVDHDFRIEIAVAIRRRPGECEHLHPARRTIRRRGKIRVVRAAAILRVGLHRVVADAAAPESVVLKITRGLREAEFVKPVVNEIAPVEKIRHRGIAIRRRRLQRQVEREIEHAPRRALRTRQVGDVVLIQIEVRIHIVPARLVHPVVDPAIRRCRHVQRGRGDERARGQRRLRRERRRVSGRERRRTVARENAVARVADVFGEAMPELHLARVRIHQQPEHFAAGLGRQNHTPAKPHRRLIHGQPHERHARLDQALRGELLAQRRPLGRADRLDILLRDFRADIPRRQRHCRHRTDPRRDLRQFAIRRSRIRRRFRHRHELAPDIHQLPARAQRRLQSALENRDAIEHLLPHDRLQTRRRRSVLALNLRARQRRRIVTEQRAVLIQKQLHRAMPFIRRERRNPRRHSAAVPVRPREKALRRTDPLRRTGHRIGVDPHIAHPRFQSALRLLARRPRRICRRQRRRRPGPFQAPVEVRQRRSLLGKRGIGSDEQTKREHS